jgi:hypothetical protein
MHDPMTVAFEIRYPWFRRGSWPHRWRFLPKSWRAAKHWPDGYRESFATIWHVDPEQHAHERGQRSDDSCGWSRAHLTDAMRKLADEMADWEQKFPLFFAQPQRVPNPEYPTLWEIGPGDAAALMLEAWSQIAWRLYQRRLSPTLAFKAMRLGHSSVDHFCGGFTNTNRDGQRDTLLWIIRAYASEVRPWYRHPRWHVHHWQINVQPAAALKRWLFTRCCRCGNAFPWGAAVCTDQWDNDGPRWFRGERNVYHADCRAPHSAGFVAAPTEDPHG